MNRNDKCYCNSGKKYKLCHLYIEQGWKQINGIWMSPRDWALQEAAKKLYGKTAKI